MTILIGINQEAVAQKKIKEGSISYKVSFPELPAEAQAMAGMMPNKLEINFTKDFSRVAMTGGMVNNTTIIDVKANKATSLMNMMGQKISTAVDMSEEVEGQEEPEIEYLDETKEVNGYKCKKAMIKTSQGNMEVFYTDEVEITAKTSATDNFKKLDGFPMEYSLSTNGMKMLMTVTDIKSEKQDASLFVIPEGYKEMSQEEVKKAFGGGF